MAGFVAKIFDESLEWIDVLRCLVPLQAAAALQPEQIPGQRRFIRRAVLLGLRFPLT